MPDAPKVPPRRQIPEAVFFEACFCEPDATLLRLKRPYPGRCDTCRAQFQIVRYRLR